MTSSGSRCLSNNDWRRIRRWYRTSGRHHLPWRRESSPWSVLLAETLLHRTRASNVEPIFQPILARFPSPTALVSAPEGWILDTTGLGLGWRARSFVKTCEILITEHGGTVPSDRLLLLNLPGVGHYTAAAVRCFGFGFREPLIDTNTIRVASRLTGVRLNPTQHRSKRFAAAVQALSEDGFGSNPDDNYALLDLASAICLPTRPKCQGCPVRSSCAIGRASDGNNVEGRKLT